MSARPSSIKARSALKLIREAIAGAVVGRHEGWWGSEKEPQLQFVPSLMLAVGVLDLYLTGSLSQRTQTDSLHAARVLIGKPWSVFLSDEQSQLVVRLPTLDDRRTVYLTDTAVPQKRWKRIDTEKAQPTEFKVTEEMITGESLI